MSLLLLCSQKLILLDIRFRVEFFLLALEKCVASFGLHNFRCGIHCDPNWCSPVVNASFLFVCFPDFFSFSFLKFNYVWVRISLGLSCSRFTQLLESVCVFFPLPNLESFQLSFLWIFFHLHIFLSFWHSDNTNITSSFIVSHILESLFIFYQSLFSLLHRLNSRLICPKVHSFLSCHHHFTIEHIYWVLYLLLYFYLCNFHFVFFYSFYFFDKIFLFLKVQDCYIFIASFLLYT